MLSQKPPQHHLFLICSLFMTLFSLLLISCTGAQVQSTVTPLPSLKSSVTAPLSPPTVTNFPRQIASTPMLAASPTPAVLASTTPFPQIHPTYVPLDPARVQQLSLKQQDAAWILLDDHYIYWATDQDTRHILRHPLIGGKTETVVTSQYPDGDLISLRSIVNQDWLIFLDTPSSADNITWVVHALNLRTQKDQILVEEPGDPISWPGPEVSADGDWVVWTRTGHSKTANCDETMLVMRNLKTGEQRELDRACTQNNYLWGAPSLIGNQLIVERDLPDSKGRGNEVYLFDLASGQGRPLTDDGQGSMPMSSQAWAVWKHGPRYKEGALNTVYNLHTGEQRDLIVPGQQMSGDPNLFDHWLYWQPGYYEPFYVFDLESSQIMTVTTPGKNEAIYPVIVYSNTIAWQRRLNADQALPQDSILEWRTLQ